MYAADITTAARFAALALTGPPPTTGADVARIQHLLTDLAVVLTHTTALATGLVPSQRRGPTAADLARRPEQVLLDQLAALATHTAHSRPGPHPPQDDASAVTAAARWAGYPTDPAAPAGPVTRWQGAVVHAFLATTNLDRPGARLDDPATRAVLHDTASLSQALAAAGRDLRPTPSPAPRPDRLQDPYTRLALAAREVAVDRHS